MPSQIQILPETLCNQIAAGEVVERPSSVVKELLENSIDAAASSIQIELERGGKSLVRIVDDGHGMGREDLLLCLERHATSKIRQDTDLFQIHTLGFRGEALPSIAAVSKFTISSRTEEGDEGWEVRVEAGQVRDVRAAGRPRGTEIEVRNLFYKLPARKKFLRRDETELGHISETVTRQALARHDVQFRLSHNGRNLIDLPRHSNPEERIGALLGRPTLRQLHPIHLNAPWGEVHGFLGETGLTRSSANAIYTYINGRFIRDRLIQHALLEGYRNLIPKGRYPVVVLFLEMAPEQVDVNVHPTKHEVRFREPGGVHDFIVAGMRDTLSAPTTTVTSVQETVQVPLSPPRQPAMQRELPATPPLQNLKSEEKDGIKEALDHYAARGEVHEASHPSTGSFQVPTSVVETQHEEERFFSRFQLIGQYRNSYLVCQEGDDLLLVDQHAAHERVGFEKLKVQLQQTGIERQRLLFPLVLELNAAEFVDFAEILPHLNRLGFDLEEFGQRAYVVKGVPQLLQHVDVETLLRDVAGELNTIGSSGLVDEALDKVLMTMACHTMVRANQSLSQQQMLALLKELDRIDFSNRCPHGRPVFTRLSLSDVEKLFHRR